MNARTQSLLARTDTFFGVCEAIGQDFGFSPTLPRAAFAILFLFSPAVVLGLYLALGAAVALSRWRFPAPAASRMTAETAMLAVPTPVAENDDAVTPLASAA